MGETIVWPEAKSCQSSRLQYDMASMKIVVALSLLLVPPVAALPEIHVSEKTQVKLVVRALTADWARGAKDPRLVVEANAESTADAVLDWPPGHGPSRLALTARLAEPSADGEQVLDVTARLTMPGAGAPVQATRSLRFAERTTSLFEVYRSGDDTLTLALEAEAEVVQRYESRPTPGAPVRFHLEIERVLEGKPILLESNDLDTFVGEPVSYSFRLGGDPDSERAKLTLKPLRIVGEMVEIETEVGGALSSTADLAVIGRTERILASRDATSTLALETGTPPVGYRFRITPRF
jgi:hypothetical protein